MKKRCGVILFALLALSVGLLWVFLAPEPIREGRCRLIRKKADPENQLTGLASRFLFPLDGKPDDVQDPPSGFEQPRYYRVTSGDRSILMAADHSEKIVRLCIDRDGDGVLSEERSLTAKVSKKTPVSSRRQQFGPISLVSRGDSRGTDADVYVNCWRADTRGLLTTSPHFFRTGKLRLAGQTYQVAVVDGDYDGLYRSMLSLPVERMWRLPECDVFAIDLNQNGSFEISLHERSEVVPLGKLVKVRDAYYAIDIAPDSKSLTLSRIEPQFGILTVDANDAAVELRLWSDAADQHLLQCRERQLPAGKYKAVYAVLTKKDASGKTCTLASNTSSAFTRLGPLEYFEIQAGQTTSIRIGPPLVVKADVQTTDSGNVSISPLIVGCGGEEYRAASSRGMQRPSPPAFKIVDEEGTVLVQDKFKYG
ncbi:MAG: hypothetical protein JW741_27900 [Sedimentisphaerales bacterium]|nr:hypothetical protein [Sedimentisphaerales bacterium]